jgi:hypothetical protein
MNLLGWSSLLLLRADVGAIPSEVYLARILHSPTPGHPPLGIRDGSTRSSGDAKGSIAGRRDRLDQNAPGVLELGFQPKSPYEIIEKGQHDVLRLLLRSGRICFKPDEIKGLHDLLDRGCGGQCLSLVLEANKARSRLLSVLLLELGFSLHLIKLLDDVTGSLEGRHDRLDQNAVEVWVAGRVVFSRERGCGGWSLRRVLDVLKARILFLILTGTQHSK